VTSTLEPLEVEPGVVEQRLVALQLAFELGELRLNGRGSISASRSPLRTICPSWKWTAISSPSTRLLTVTC